MLVVGAEPSSERWAGVLLELRVEDHPNPLVELRRLWNLHRAYEHMNQGDDLLGEDRVEEALEQYRTAAQMAPQIAELPFWQAVTLADLGRVGEALPLFRDVFARDPNLAVLVQRLPGSELLRDDPQMMARILRLRA
jgi:tetratricopeptide (TPR) repeat protein